MLSRDHYAVLGVSPDADNETIDAAFRRLSRRYHPDLNPGDARAQTAFERLKMAHDILTDSRERARYDSEGHATAKDIEVLTRTSTEVKNETRSYADLFRHLCDNARRARPKQGRDVHTPVVCRLADTERGRRTTIEVRRLHRCLDCSGAGRLYDGNNAPCSTCMGSGKEVFGRGPLAVAVTCGDCSGEGLQAGAACGACHASGLTTRNETLPLQIPAGVQDGQTIRIDGGGHQGRKGSPPGDLVATVSVQGDPRFQRNGPHLVTSVPITVSEAILGARIEMPTIDGTIALLRVPPGTRGGDRLRVRGRGLEMTNGRCGDLIAVIDLWLPDNLDEDARRLIREFGNRTDEPVRNQNERATVNQ
jgi:molecular chaperone DnaJ